MDFRGLSLFVCFKLYLILPRYFLFSHLKHRAYIDSLPEPSELLTPLHFTAAELALLNGTNLLGATLDRRKEWESEWREVRDIFADAVISWGEGLTWCVPSVGLASNISRNNNANELILTIISPRLLFLLIV